jgi:hypothetical protein
LEPKGSANDNRAPRRERRARPRRKVLLSGRLSSATPTLSLECQIRNLSERGALIVSDSVVLPDNPFLVMVKHAYLHEARIAWRDGDKSGLSFRASWRVAAGYPDRLERVEDAWLGRALGFDDPA